MLRKVLIFLTILLIAFLGYFSYKLLKEQEVAVNALIDAVPFDASLIVEINRPELLFDIIYSPPIDAESFLNIPFIRDPLEKLKTIDSIAAQDKNVRSVIRRAHSTIISGHQVGKEELEMVYYLKLNHEKEFSSIDKIIKKSIKARGNISQHNYEDARVNDVTIFNRRSGGFSYAYYRGMLILSKSSILVEEVIRQSNSGTSIRTKTGLETVMKTAGKSSPFNVYINFDYFPTLALNFVHSRFRSELDAISKFAHWIELDCNVDNNAIILNGFSAAENTKGFLSDIFQDQQPLRLSLPGLLPSGTKSFFSLGITNYSNFRINFSDYQKKNLSNPDFDKNLANFREKTGVDLESEFVKAFEEEVCFSYFPDNSGSLTNSIFTVIKAKGTSEANEFISRITVNNESGKADSTTGNRSFFKTTSNIPKLLFGNVFGLNNNSFCTTSENYIIFGDSLAHLNAFAREFAEQKNLSQDLDYRNLADLLSEDTYCYFYLSPDAQQLYRHYLRYTSDQMLSQYKYGLSQVQAIVYQFGRNNDLFYNNAFIQFAPKPQGNITKQWEVTLDNTLHNQIQIVKNHTSSENELIFQDKSNNVYLVSDDGKILWKKKVEGPILGSIYQADLFKNKRLQFVFNTKNQVIALDRNGKEVEGFPVKLTRKANGGMAVFDYDKTRNYRFILPLTDNKLYCLDQTGKEVEGWKKPTIGKNPGKIQYFANNGKDFIVLTDETGIHFFDRKGQSRIKTTERLIVAPNSDVFASATKNTFHFETTDSTGSIKMISLNGDVTKVQTGIYPPYHYYIPADINFDKLTDHLFFYDRKFEAYTNSGARIVNHSLSGEVSLHPKIISIKDSTYLFSYTDTTAGKVFLNSSKGVALEGTPLTGNSEITVEAYNNSEQIVNIYYCNNNILICISVK